MKDDIQTFYPENRKSWRDWLQANHASEKSVWVIYYKKASKIPTISYDDSVDEALCFGWIDSKINKRDEVSFMRYFARRNPKSNWSRVNKEKVVRLMEAGLMEEPGVKMVEFAKASGTWNALDEVENLVIPPDMLEEFDKFTEARENWESFPRSVKRSILEWILNAKRPATRAKRITETVEKADKNIRANQYTKS